MYIDGSWCDAASGRTFETRNPYTGKVWALLPRADADDVDRAVQAAHAAFTAAPGRPFRRATAACCCTGSPT